MTTPWGFYGRTAELGQLREILGRRRWFFARISGRRRIGKTSLIQQALSVNGSRRILYVQIPDSAPAGVLSTVGDALATFNMDPAFRQPATLSELAQLVGQLVERGVIVALDEFQYFARKRLHEFTSHLQAVVDRLSANAANVQGGLFVLGSIHTEIVALLENRDAPLYNRTTDHIELGHLDISSVLTILRTHADDKPARLLFLWNMFEGVPKFYRDCFEQGVLSAEREDLLEKMFFQSSSPLRSEADNWFLHELRGRYDVILKYLARNPGCTNGDLESHVRSISDEKPEQVGGYLKILMEKYEMVERKLPVFATPKARKGRYYICDNFLRAWLSALSNSIAALNFRPVAELVARADERLVETEGHGLERLVGQLYEERSRKAIGDFPITELVQGFWDRNDTEIDLVALNSDSKVIRLGTCKRSSSKLAADLGNFGGHVDRFLRAFPEYSHWTVERVVIATEMGPATRSAVQRYGYIAQDLHDLTCDL